MRFLNICLLLFLCNAPVISGVEISIISAGNLKGLADEKGKIVIPAIYEEIGWSDGSFTLEKEVTGYLSKGMWGLINTKNKKITGPIYKSLIPVNEKAFIASRKADLSNHLLHGLINEKGEVLVPFNYFEINRLSADRIMVGEYRKGRVWYGIRNVKDDELIPADYQSVRLLENLLVCSREDGLMRIFNLDGQSVYPGWLEQVSMHPGGFEIVEQGRRGLISTEHLLVSIPGSKDLSKDGSLQSFNQWEVRSVAGDSVFFQSCDSITFLNEKLWIAHVNNAQHMLGAHEKLFSNQNYLLKYIQRGFIVAQNKHTDKWGLYKTNGDVIEEGYDLIEMDSNYFYCQSDNSWEIYSAFSRKLNKQRYEDVGSSLARNIPVKKNGFWGWIDFHGDQLVPFKFDQLRQGIGNQYVARYIDKWGIAAFPESWIALPEFDSVIVDDEFYLASKGRATYIIDAHGDLVLRTGYDVFTHDDVIYLRDEHKYGLVTELGVIVRPEYEYIRKVGDFYVCRKDSLLDMYNPYGRKVLGRVDEVQEVFGYSEGYFHILKDGKHGFVDEDGKLRIANRYDGALLYKEGLAAVKLRGRWGYINKWEQLVVQPHYDTCSEFENGLANVSMNGKHGIINSKGEVVISHSFNGISRTRFGNYIMTDDRNKQGLADSYGKVLLRADFDELIDTTHDFVIARRGDSYGVVTYKGHSYLPFDYRHVEVQGDYLLLLGN